MDDELRDDDRDFAERAADATEETRRRAGEEGRTIEDQPETGRLLGDAPDDEPDVRT